MTILLSLHLFFISTALSASTLLGHYKLYSTFGSAHYDYSGSNNHAEHIYPSSPRYTSYGVALTDGQIIKFPTNIYADSPNYSKFCTSFWVYLRLKGYILRMATGTGYLDFKTFSTTEFVIEAKSNDGTVVISYSDNTSFNTWDKWNLLTLQTWTNGSDLEVEISVVNEVQSLYFSHTITSYAEILGQNSYWQLGSSSESCFCYVYELYWYNNNDDSLTSLSSVLKSVSLPTSNGTLNTQCTLSCYLPSCYNRSTIQCAAPCPETCECVSLSDLCNNCIESNLIQVDNVCKCDVGYEVNPSLDPYCREIPDRSCTDNCDMCQDNVCVECQTDYYLLEEMCYLECPDEYYEANNQIAKCLACLSGCKECSYYEVCSECMSSFYLQPDGSCDVKCGEGYYQGINQPLRCIGCSEHCKTCSESKCMICNNGYYMLNSQCRVDCPDGFYETTSQPLECQACSEHCKTCSENECSECNDEYYMLNNVCSNYCPSTYYTTKDPLQCKSCIPSCLSCIDNLSCSTCEVGYTYDPILISCIHTIAECTENCNSCDSSSGECLECSDGFVISYEDSMICEACQKLCRECEWNEEEKECLSCVDFGYLEEGECKCFVEQVEDYECAMKCPEGYEVNQDGKSCECQGNCTGNDSTDEDSTQDLVENSSDSSYKHEQSLKNSSSIMSQSVFTIMFVISYFLSIPEYSLSLMNTIQLFYIIPLFHQTLPSFLHSTLQAQQDYIILPNIFTYIISESTPKPYYSAQNSGFTTSFFFQNSGKAVFIFILLSIFYILVTILSKFSSGKFKSHSKSLKQKMTYNSLNTYLIQFYLELGIAAYIQIQYPSGNSFNTVTNYIFGILFTILSAVLPLLVVYFLITRFSKLGDETYTQRWGSWYRELDITRKSSAVYYGVFLVRRYALIVIINFMRYFATPQIVLAVIVNWITLLYTYTAKPFKSKLIGIMLGFNEMLIALSYTICATFVGNVDEESVGISVIVMMYLTYGIHIILFTRHAVILIRAKFCRKTNTKVQAEEKYVIRETENVMIEVNIEETSRVRDQSEILYNKRSFMNYTTEPI